MKYYFESCKIVSSSEVLHHKEEHEHRATCGRVKEF